MAKAKFNVLPTFLKADCQPPCPPPSPDRPHLSTVMGPLLDRPETSVIESQAQALPSLAGAASPCIKTVTPALNLAAPKDDGEGEVHSQRRNASRVSGLWLARPRMQSARWNHVDKNKQGKPPLLFHPLYHPLPRRGVAGGGCARAQRSGRLDREKSIRESSGIPACSTSTLLSSLLFSPGVSADAADLAPAHTQAHGPAREGRDREVCVARLGGCWRSVIGGTLPRGWPSSEVRRIEGSGLGVDWFFFIPAQS